MRLPPRRDLLFVGAQLALFVALAVDPFPVTARVHPWMGATGLLACAGAVGFGVAAVFQLGSNLTPWPSPKSSSALVTAGAYGLARHPIYASLLAFGLGLSLWTFSPWRLAVTAALYALFRAKARYEERLLAERYPDYEDYAARVPRFGV